jgi:predicted amidohydrolase
VLVKIVAFQARMGQPLTLAERIYVFKQRPDFLCLPEYFLLGSDVANHTCAAQHRDEHLAWLTALSDDLDTCLIGGSVVEAVDNRLYNTCYLINRGLVLGRYRKRNPVAGELARGVSPGADTTVIEVDGVRVGLMICGDVFFPSMYDDLRDLNVDIIFIPTTSPFLPDDSPTARARRDEAYFLDGARRSGAYVVKTCGVGTLFGRPLQGRSLIAAPWGIVRPADEAALDRVRILTEILDIGAGREFRTRLNRLRCGGRGVE